MTIREQEIFLRLTLMWLMKTHFFLRFDIEPYDWHEAAIKEYSEVCLGEVYDNFHGSVEDIFFNPHDNATKYTTHEAYAWMAMYERWCDARLSATESPPVWIFNWNRESGLYTHPVYMDQTVAERFVASRGWSHEVGASLIEPVKGEERKWWGKRWGPHSEYSVAGALGDVVREELRADFPEFSIR